MQLFSAALFELSMISAISLLSVPRWSTVDSSNILYILEPSKSSFGLYANAYHTSKVNICVTRKWELTTHCTHWAFKKVLSQVISMTPLRLLCLWLFRVLFRHLKMKVQKPAAGPKSHIYSAIW